ncbi:MAG: cell division ATP-binding protein FtsE [Dehalococcoidia bacterium]|nr:cell division ATP-binding protein FtsE [Dehalococcoidia bacterium]
MIVLRNVSKRYDDGTVALRGVTLMVPRDDFVFLVGPNGAGKTTLLRLLNRAETPSDGCILVNGQDLQDLDEHEISRFRQHIGIVFQDTRLFPDRTVYENVEFSLQVSGEGGRRANELVWQALDVVGLADHAERLPGALSGGEAQRAAIARAIVRQPRLLLADEPTANLPPAMAWQVLQVLTDINYLGVTTLIATHDRDVVDRMRQRVVELSRGFIVRDQRGGHFAA